MTASLLAAALAGDLLLLPALLISPLGRFFPAHSSSPAEPADVADSPAFRRAIIPRRRAS